MEERRQEDRFRALYAGSRRQIFAYALRRARTPEDAADVAAETFAIAWRRIDSVPEGADALVWLYATARNVLANEARRGRRRSSLVERLGATLAAHGTLVAPPDEGALLALAALRTLRKDDREVLMLSAWEGLDAAGVGRVVGCSPGAARIRLHRARRRLEEAIADLSGVGAAGKHEVVSGHREDESAAFGCAQEEA